MSRRIITVFVLVLALSIFAFGSNSQALWQDDPNDPPITEDMGGEGIPVGNFCSVKDVCVITRNEEDCTKLGGAKVESCESLEGKVEKE